MDLEELEKRISELEAELSSLREERIPSVDRASRRRDKRLTLAYLLVAALALGLAGVGSASALDGSNTVFSDDIVDGTVAGVDIRDQSVGGVDVKNGSIGTVDVADGSLTGEDVADSSIYNTDVANGTLGGQDVADDSLGSIDITDNSLGGVDISDGSIGGTDVADGSLTGEDINLTNDNQCNGETVQGTAVVNADPAVPSSFTTSWLGWQHSCSGAQVRVKRIAVGWYEIDFNSPSRLAVATVSQSATIGEATAVNIYEGGFYVYVSNSSGASTDLDFSILAY